jgi:hypothetical protein
LLSTRLAWAAGSLEQVYLFGFYTYAGLSFCKAVVVGNAATVDEALKLMNEIQPVDALAIGRNAIGP